MSIIDLELIVITSLIFFKWLLRRKALFFLIIILIFMIMNILLDASRANKYNQLLQTPPVYCVHPKIAYKIGSTLIFSYVNIFLFLHRALVCSFKKMLSFHSVCVTLYIFKIRSGMRLQCIYLKWNAQKCAKM